MKKILGVQNAPQQHWVGDGFPVRSLFTYGSHGKELSPFLMLDYAAPYEFDAAETPRGVGEHPHRGFETVTIVYEGELAHRDSTGASGRIGPGDVQWMTAASGILHEEFHSPEFTRSGGSMEMVQLWVNLPKKDKMSTPHYQDLLKADIPVVELPDGANGTSGSAGTLRVIAGEYAGKRGPAKTFTPIEVWDIVLRRDGKVRLALPAGHTAAVVVLRGTVQVNGGTVAREAQMVVLDREGSDIEIEANGEAKVLVLGGEPIDEPIAGYGPFVMNSQGEIKQAILDFQSGKFGSMPEAKAEGAASN